MLKTQWFIMVSTVLWGTMGGGGLEPLPLAFIPPPPLPRPIVSSKPLPVFHYTLFLVHPAQNLDSWPLLPCPSHLPPTPTPTPLPIFHQSPHTPSPLTNWALAPLSSPQYCSHNPVHECQPRSIKLYGCRPMNSISTRQWNAIWLFIIIFLQNRHPTACLRATNLGCILSVYILWHKPMTKVYSHSWLGISVYIKVIIERFFNIWLNTSHTLPCPCFISISHVALQNAYVTGI